MSGHGCHICAAFVVLRSVNVHLAGFSGSSACSGPHHTHTCTPLRSLSRVAARSLAALRLSAYSQLEYVTAAMLARHVRPGGARVLQVGRTTGPLRVPCVCVWWGWGWGWGWGGAGGLCQRVIRKHGICMSRLQGVKSSSRCRLHFNLCPGFCPFTNLRWPAPAYDLEPARCGSGFGSLEARDWRF